MSRVVLYQGHTITSYPIHESESGQWQLNIVISGEEKGSTFSRSYWMPLTYPTETEASTSPGLLLVNALSMGRLVVFH